MSHALGRLRVLIDDPVLVRTPRGMIPTPRAQELIGPIREALAKIEATVARSPRFEPATARRSFTVATVDYVELILLPRLVQKLVSEAPFIDLVARPYDSEMWSSMETGKVDLAIGLLPPCPQGFTGKGSSRSATCASCGGATPRCGQAHAQDVHELAARAHQPARRGRRPGRRGPRRTRALAPRGAADPRTSWWRPTSWPRPTSC